MFRRVIQTNKNFIKNATQKRHEVLEVANDYTGFHAPRYGHIFARIFYGVGTVGGAYYFLNIENNGVVKEVRMQHVRAQ